MQNRSSQCKSLHSQFCQKWLIQKYVCLSFFFFERICLSVTIIYYLVIQWLCTMQTFPKRTWNVKVLHHIISWWNSHLVHVFATIKNTRSLISLSIIQVSMKNLDPEETRLKKEGNTLDPFIKTDEDSRLSTQVGYRLSLIVSEKKINLIGQNLWTL